MKAVVVKAVVAGVLLADCATTDAERSQKKKDRLAQEQAGANQKQAQAQQKNEAKLLAGDATQGAALATEPPPPTTGPIRSEADTTRLGSRSLAGRHIRSSSAGRIQSYLFNPHPFSPSPGPPATPTPVAAVAGRPRHRAGRARQQLRRHVSRCGDRRGPAPQTACAGRKDSRTGGLRTHRRRQPLGHRHRAADRRKRDCRLTPIFHPQID